MIALESVMGEDEVAAGDAVEPVLKEMLDAGITRKQAEAVRDAWRVSLLGRDDEARKILQRADFSLMAVETYLKSFHYEVA